MIETSEVIIKTVPTLVGVAAGRLWPVVHQRIRTYRTRQFWRPFSRADRVRVIVGVHGGLEQWEASGLVGVGCVEGLREMQRTWSENRLGELDAVFVGGERPGVIDGDLVLLGGPDANWATRMIADRLPGNLLFGDPERHAVTFTDKSTNRRYSPQGGGRSPLLRDFGVVKLASNPFSEGTKVIIAAGAFGYGTWAGPLLMRTKKFLDHPVVRKGGDFECLFGVDIIGGAPVNPTIEVLYALDAVASAKA